MTAPTASPARPERFIARFAAALFGLLAVVGCGAEVVPTLDRGIAPLGGAAPADRELVFSSATSLAARIRERQLTSVQVVQAFIRQIRAENGRWNAVVLLDAAGALQRAAEADAALDRGELWGPLHGVPVTIKDSYSVAGLRTTAGHVPLADHVPTEDATEVALLRDAGAVILGKTNLAQLAMDMQTTNPLFGTTPNAWDPARTSGGSSGGCATALATGMTPLSLGSDLAGSVRLPAAFSGVYGFKPTHGVTSLRGHIPPLPGEIYGIRELAVAGPLARSIEDLELAVRVLARTRRTDSSARPIRPLESPPTHLGALRIAYTSALGGAPVSVESQRAIEAFVSKLRAAGAQVTRAEPVDLDYVRTWETWGALVGAQGGYERSNVARSFAEFFVGGQVAHLPMQRRILGPITVPDHMAALSDQDRQVDALERFLADYDAWIVPVASTTAFPHHAPSDTYGTFNVYDDPIRVDGQPVPYYVATQSYTTLFSVTGSPVVSMPVRHSAEGLPIGVQIVGRRAEDLRLLRVAALLDTVVERRPFPLERAEQTPDVARR